MWLTIMKQLIILKSSCQKINTLSKMVSGALLLWEFINAKVPPPTILQYVNDRDLWLNQLPDYQYVFEGIVYLKPNVEIMEDLIFNTDDLPIL